MTHPLLIALATSLAATLAVHLGLPEAVVGVLRRIAQCAKCSAFWITLTVLLTTSHPPLLSAGLSLAASYLTHWFSLVFVKLQQIYDVLWQKLNREK
jgi:hypothetical protein